MSWDSPGWREAASEYYEHPPLKWWRQGGAAAAGK
jgi:hypothetical protein